MIKTSNILKEEFDEFLYKTIAKMGNEDDKTKRLLWSGKKPLDKPEKVG